jgi:hypothetical protein
MSSPTICFEKYTGKTLLYYESEIIGPGSVPVIP